MWRRNINLTTGWPFFHRFIIIKMIFSLCVTPFSVSELILNLGGEKGGVVNWSPLLLWHSPNQLITHLLLLTLPLHCHTHSLGPWVPRLRRLNDILHPHSISDSSSTRGWMEATSGCPDSKSGHPWGVLGMPRLGSFFPCYRVGFSSHPCSPHSWKGCLCLVLQLTHLYPKHNLQGRLINSEGS